MDTSDRFGAVDRRLEPGSRLGPYRIDSLIGAGGMGEVYRATDTRLGRTVAIKVVPPHLRSSPDLQARFEREARTISQLTHPHICTLHDVGHENGIDFLVMEHLEGETLAERLARVAISLDQALRIGVEIATALDHAHRHGVVHRDLKPGNVMLTKTGAKLLDFGLAKLRQPAVAVAASAATMPAADTAAGTLLGTLQYMAPEQLEGKEADVRSDIWALGCVLYELAAGRKAFVSPSHAGLIAAILERQPEPLARLQPLAPAALDRLVRTCLAKVPDERWQSAADLTRELQWIGEMEPDTAARVRPSGRVWKWTTAGSLVTAAGLAVLLALAWRAPAELRRSEQFEIVLPGSAPLAAAAAMPLAIDKAALALSDDGSRLAYVGQVGDRTQIFVRDMASGDVAAVPGTEGGHSPFFSPAGDSLGFFAGGRLQRVSLAGGTPVTLADASSGWGGVWSPDGAIFFTPLESEGIVKITESREPPERISRVQVLAPALLPPGRGLLAASGGTIVAIKDGHETEITSGFSPRYVETGHLLYAVRGAVMGVGFDPEAARTTGSPVTLISGVRTAPYSVAQFALSRAGTLVYAAGRHGLEGTLVWADSSGRITPAGLPRQTYESFAVSRDGKRVAVQQHDSNGQGSAIWIYEIGQRGDPVRLTPRDPDDDRGTNSYPRWTPDGRHVIYTRIDRASAQLMIARADGSGEVVRLWSRAPGGPNWLYPMSFSPDGRTLAVFGGTPNNSFEMYTVRIREPDGRIVTGAPLEPLRMNTRYGEAFPQFSPRGDAIAFTSDSSGRTEIWVAAHPGGERRCPVSRDGGFDPSWTPDGKAIVYQSGTAFMMAAVHSLASGCEIGEPKTLFTGPFADRPGFAHDMTGDGRLLLVHSENLLKTSPTLRVVTNFLDELQRRIPRR